MTTSTLVSLGVLFAVLINPSKSVKRRIIGMLHDFGILSYMLYLMDEAAAPAFVVYLWVTIGNGIRYGTPYLYGAMVLSLVGFSCVFVYSDYWSQHRDVSIGIYVGLVVLPLYVSKLVRQLNFALEEARYANASKSKFLANMSHEIRTPLHGVLGFLGLMRKTDLTPQQQEYLAPVEQSARNLLKIINEILDLSRIEAGRISIRNEPISFREVLTSTIALLQPQAGDKGISLQSEIDASVPALLIGDPTRVSQIVSNLVDNAIKFTNRGSVTVTMTCESKTDDTDRLRIVVSDTGIGIAADQIDKLFEPFHQAESGRNRRYGGTGLGLSITKNLVEAMGGVIGIESEPGLFTKIIVELPLLAVPSSASPPADPRHDGASLFNGSGLSVLVVDDNDINGELLTALLGTYSFTVHSVTSGREALKVSTERHYDIIFMDIHMAGLDGVVTTEYLRALHEYQGIECFVIAVSADVIGSWEDRVADASFDAFVTKPVEEAELLRLIGGLFPDRIQKHEANDIGFHRGNDGVLDRDAGIQYAAGDESLWRQNLTRMIGRLPAQVDELRQAFACGQYKQMKQLAHLISGSASYLAANRVADVVRAMESACDMPEQERIMALLNDLEVESTKLKVQIENEYRDLPRYQC